MSTPKRQRIQATPSSSQRKMKQSSLLSFFQKKEPTTSKPAETKLKEESKPLSFTTESSANKPAFDHVDRLKQSQNTDVSPDSSFLNDSRNASSPIKDSTTSNTTIDLPDVSLSRKAAVDGHASAVSSSKQAIKFKEEDDEEEEDFINVSSSQRKRKKINYNESSEEDDGDDEFETSFSGSTKRKRSKLVVAPANDSDEDEYVPDSKSVKLEEEEEQNYVRDVEKSESSGEDDDLDILALEKKVATKKMQSASSSLMNRLKKSPVKAKPKSSSQKSRSQSSNSVKSSNREKSNSNSPQGTQDSRYNWLTKGPRKDANKNPVDHPDFDPRTIYIPQSAWDSFTDFEKQYWNIKKNLMDCIVFFKKGKFYELYENDALLANHMFDLKLAGNGGRAGMQLAGIPEMSFDYWTNQFLQNGYKVAKVDQAESLLAKEMREKQEKTPKTSAKSIVQRELKYVLTRGTLTDETMLQSDLPTYCLSIKQQDNSFGISFVDTATGELFLVQIDETGPNDYSKLDTVLSQVRAHEVVMERNNLSSAVLKLVKYNSAPGCIYNYLRKDDEFYDVDKTIHELNTKYTKIPEVIARDFIENFENHVALNAFGGLLSYLQFLKLDKNIIDMDKASNYDEFMSSSSSNQKYMVLDGITLQNLEIFANTFDGSDQGTFFKLINRATTGMGKRMIRKWVMLPLFQKPEIEDRLDSVDQLIDDFEIRELVENYLAKLSDLERLCARVHSNNLKFKEFNNKVLPGFENILEFIQKIKKFELKGSMKEYVARIPETLLDEKLKEWANAYDRNNILGDDQEYSIKLYPGVDKEYDQSLNNINECAGKLSNELNSYKSLLKTTKLQFKDSGKELYTIEVPIEACKRVPGTWTQLGANKSFKRYYSPEVASLAQEMAEYKEAHKILETNLTERLYLRFAENMNDVWTPTVELIASVDCLLSLCKTSESIGIPSCRPQFVDSDFSFLQFKSLRHPYFNMGSSSTTEFIPNDVELGLDETNKITLLTGANAAGKSTVLRMTCIATIMAQIGCYVPCEYAKLTPVDRIMTRLGANDNIMQGKSTFLVELSETKKILDLATDKSLLVIDELGRGGSSSDGFAIAESVLYHCSTHIQNLGFFATHYGEGLYLNFAQHPQIRPMKMAILCDEENKNVTFLYKLVDGLSEGSFGMHVANMCGIPKEIVDNAIVAADELEHTSKVLKMLKNGRTDQKNEATSADSSTLIPLGVQTDFVRIMEYGINNLHGCGEGVKVYNEQNKKLAIKNIFEMIEGLSK
ncbi:hypothetical protein ACO0QE_002811 [Hanseniaspora vineae]